MDQGMLRRAWDRVVQDLGYAVRTLRRDAGFAVFALLILGLGIGATHRGVQHRASAVVPAPSVS